ncbi:MAG: ASCH domain-containing protein [Nannocystis sp.]|uniref:ASCH domain-containing protein n=1 Tax=Nannocystis sp. TaxID=1962667 RepID=UPI002429B9CC|nr:ASCH domain-containing protein [Nannocystis sp.]MBK9755892.1 ASCH domain-containing protein [Nannocystis sp.]
MRALSIRQPWIELILRGEKDVENRSWNTRHRGPLLLHASRTIETIKAREHGLSDFITGCILGVVDVRDCTKEVRSRWHISGHFGWYLTNPRRFGTPIPYRAKVGLFHVNDELLGDVEHGTTEGVSLTLPGFDLG